ncbi:peptidase S8/S53 domain-containing protein, partial [Catenaria anguillulae PL171]
MRFPLLFALLALSAVASAQDLPTHEKIVAPAYIPDTASILKGKYIVQFSRPPAASVTAQRRERASAASLETGVKEQQESFGVYCRRNQLPVKVNRRYTKLLNAASVNIKNSEDLVKVANAPGVKAIFPVVQHTIPVEPQALKNPVVPQYAHNLTKINLVNERFPDLTGKDVKVGVIDSGIDWKHPAFAIPGQKCETFKGPGCRVLYGSDFVGDLVQGFHTPAATPQPDNDPLDCGGHGTHVAGIIGGFDDKVKGVAPEAIFGAYRVFGCDGKTDNAIILAALEQAYQDGGAHVGADNPYAQAIDTLVDNGVYVIAAASNDGGKGYSYVTAPSIASKAFSIASFDNSHTYTTTAQVEGADGLGEIWFDYSPSDGVTQRFDQATK